MAIGYIMSLVRFVEQNCRNPSYKYHCHLASRPFGSTAVGFLTIRDEALTPFLKILIFSSVVTKLAYSWSRLICGASSREKPGTPGVPGFSWVAIVPCFSWVRSFNSTPCSLFFDPDSLSTSSSISVSISRSSSKRSYSMVHLLHLSHLIPLCLCSLPCSLRASSRYSHHEVVEGKVADACHHGL